MNLGITIRMFVACLPEILNTHMDDNLNFVIESAISFAL